MNYDTHTHTHSKKDVVFAERTIMEAKGFAGSALEGTGQN